MEIMDVEVEAKNDNSNVPSETRQVPTACEQEPIHIINRIQPCGYLINVNRDLAIVQCSANAMELLPPQQISQLAGIDLAAASDLLRPSSNHRSEYQYQEDSEKRKAVLDSIIGKSLSLVLGEEHVQQVKQVIENVFLTGGKQDEKPARGQNSGLHVSPIAQHAGEGTRNFIVRSKGTVDFSGRLSCSVLPSGGIFLLELEKTPPLELYSHFEDHDIMSFMEDIAKELRKCWSIEQMASLVCARVMAETPYDRGMVYKFDHEDCGEVVYESLRADADMRCLQDSYLGLRFPASDIPKQARELFMKNTLRYVYDVGGSDWALYPPMVRKDGQLTGFGEMTYTDLSMCRLRGSSYVHLKYLRNMGVTSSMVIAIIVNKRLWGLYAFHGYRGPLVPSARTRFLCEMASITTSIIMESLTRKHENKRLIRLESTLNKLESMSWEQFFQANLSEITGSLEVDLIAYRVREPSSTPILRTYLVGHSPATIRKELTNNVFDSLVETYGQVCRDYRIVYIDSQKSNALLADCGIYTLVFFCISGIDFILSRSRTVERVTWGGDPEKKLEPDGTLTPRNSFAAYVKDHIRKGKPWDQCDRQLVGRFVDQLEKFRSIELNLEHTKTIMTLQQEKKDAVDMARVNLDFFAHMAHELRTPFHGILGSLEAMREDPALYNNELLRTAEQCGKSMIKILDDILLVAKGSFNLQLDKRPFEIRTFIKETLGDMASYALMEGVSIRLRKEDIFYENLLGDFQRTRQVINNLVSNAIKFSEEDIFLDVMQRKTLSEVVAVWKTYANIYPVSEPSLVEISTFLAANASDHSPNTVWNVFSVMDKGIGISGADLKKLGKAFTQLSSGRQKKYQGTGLGITICNMLISALGGKLVMFSAKGLGSCFTFAIPLTQSNIPVPRAKADETLDEKKKKMERLQEEFDALGFRDKGIRVLIVDDSAINRKLCGRKIRRWMPHVNITECSSGVAALGEYEQNSSNIMGIFMDYHMHDMDGDECTRRIREYESMHEDVSNIYIAGYTADVLDDSTGKLISAGMNSVIPKPEPARAIEDELRKMMNWYSKNH